MHGLSKPTANVSIEALRVELSAIHKRAHAITAERANLALPATLGDTKAKARIAEIDAERTLCAGRVETIEAAIRTLQQQDSQHDWRRHLPYMQKAFTYELGLAYSAAKGHLSNILKDRIDPLPALKELEGLEAKVARQVADGQLPRLRLPLPTSRADLDEAQRLKTARNALVAVVASELLKVDVKRPDNLERMVTIAQEVVKVRADNMRAQTYPR